MLAKVAISVAARYCGRKCTFVYKCEQALQHRVYIYTIYKLRVYMLSHNIYNRRIVVETTNIDCMWLRMHLFF